MGQLITVVEKPTARADVVRYDLNRSLTGMSHERYTVSDPVSGDRPPDELARRLFARGGIDAVHVYSNVVTVDLAAGADSAGIADVIHGLFTYYTEGVTPAEP